mmetsp:Transcript_43085/g.111643  ORF Transcript_43085/g.111643 Transcript_43085/m.111643 type:complete len:839 (-) Transcript_43085:1371-3887(-)
MEIELSPLAWFGIAAAFFLPLCVFSFVLGRGFGIDSVETKGKRSGNEVISKVDQLGRDAQGEGIQSRLGADEYGGQVTDGKGAIDPIQQLGGGKIDSRKNEEEHEGEGTTGMERSGQVQDPRSYEESGTYDPDGALKEHPSEVETGTMSSEEVGTMHTEDQTDTYVRSSGDTIDSAAATVEESTGRVHRRDKKGVERGSRRGVGKLEEECRKLAEQQSIALQSASIFGHERCVDSGEAVMSIVTKDDAQPERDTIVVDKEIELAGANNVSSRKVDASKRGDEKIGKSVVDLSVAWSEGELVEGDRVHAEKKDKGEKGVEKKRKRKGRGEKRAKQYADLAANLSAGKEEAIPTRTEEKGRKLVKDSGNENKGDSTFEELIEHATSAREEELGQGTKQGSKNEEVAGLSAVNADNRAKKEDSRMVMTGDEVLHELWRTSLSEEDSSRRDSEGRDSVGDLLPPGDIDGALPAEVWTEWAFETFDEDGQDGLVQVGRERAHNSRPPSATSRMSRSSSIASNCSQKQMLHLINGVENLLSESSGSSQSYGDVDGGFVERHEARSVGMEGHVHHNTMTTAFAPPSLYKEGHSNYAPSPAVTRAAMPYEPLVQKSNAHRQRVDRIPLAGSVPPPLQAPLINVSHQQIHPQSDQFGQYQPSEVSSLALERRHREVEAMGVGQRGDAPLSRAARSIPASTEVVGRNESLLIHGGPQQHFPHPSLRQMRMSDGGDMPRPPPLRLGAQVKRPLVVGEKVLPDANRVQSASAPSAAPAKTAEVLGDASTRTDTQSSSSHSPSEVGHGRDAFGEDIDFPYLAPPPVPAQRQPPLRLGPKVLPKNRPISFSR